MIIKFDFSRVESLLIDRYMEAIDANKKRIQLAHKRRTENSNHIQKIREEKTTMSVERGETKRR